MSILIRGMEMPKIGYEDIRVLADGSVTATDHRPPYYRSDYRAIPVPPHGDLIDRKTAYDSLLNGMVMTGYQSRALDCISDFYVPTIIPADPAEEGEG